MYAHFKKILLNTIQCKKFLIAYSGGVDSHVLLHLMSRLQAQEINLTCRAIHINHGLNNKASHWQRHCQRVCHALGISLDIKHVDLNFKKSESIEAVARHARYDQFKKALQDDEVLLTAHNQDDQAETVLLQLLRGAGPKGLSAMPYQKSFAQGLHVRPLLQFSRSAIEVYANEHQLSWIEDDSNLDERFDRNYIRHRLMPVIKKRWPQANRILSRVARHCAAADNLVDKLACDDLCSVRVALGENFLFDVCQIVYHGKINHFIDLKKLVLIPRDRQYNVLRYWLRLHHLSLPSTQQLQEIFHNLIDSKYDAVPLIHYENFELRRFREQLWLVPRLFAFDTAIVIPWNQQKVLQLPYELGRLLLRKTSPGILNPDLINKKLCIRFRQGGEQIKLAGRKGTHRLKKLLQEVGIPPWLRDCLPLLYADNKLVAVANWIVAAEMVVKSDEEGLILNWQAEH